MNKYHFIVIVSHWTSSTTDVCSELQLDQETFNENHSTWWTLQ